jgi:hypothetical protein
VSIFEHARADAPNSSPTVLRPRRLVGRDSELRDISESVGSAPVTTLVGPGGVGKTALAITVAAACSQDFPGGVTVVWLGSLRSADLVAAEVAVQLGLPRESQTVKESDMFISLFSLRQWIFASAGIGSLLVASIPVAFCESPEFQIAADPYSSFLYQNPLSAKPTLADEPSSETPSPPEHPASMAERIVKPGHAVLPPPGTLGKTYLRTSWPIPKDEHPRTAIIQIDAPGVSEIEFEGLADMEGFERPDGLWIFRTERPLLPGVPHIYHVKAGYRGKEPHWEVRTVRLIPGRVVTLEF